MKCRGKSKSFAWHTELLVLSHLGQDINLISKIYSAASMKRKVIITDTGIGIYPCLASHTREDVNNMHSMI